MNVISLNNLWSYLQGLSLTASNQRWLGERLIEAASSRESSSEESAKLNKLNALYGVWSGAEGEQIENAIRQSRKAGYHRTIESMNS